MAHFHSLEECSLQNAWLSVGVFDGVHRGHQILLRQLVSGAHAENNPAVVLTFSPHPAVVLGGKTDFKCLTTPEERSALLDSLGVDGVILQTFDQTLANQTAEQFMARAVKQLGVRRMLVGYDTALGRGRQGNAARLGEIGKELGFTVETVSPLAAEDGIISSTRIRARLAAGDVAAAARDLGRKYTVAGPVIHGDGRGHTIRVPTANIQVPEGKIIPANGIYVCWTHVGEEKVPTVTNIGTRPTFTPDEFIPHVEAHLLDFERDLYGREIELEFIEYLRPEQKFSSVQALIDAIRDDILQARKILKQSPELR